MITDEIKELIVPQLNLLIQGKQLDLVDLFFSEVYEYQQDGMKLIALYPAIQPNISPLFDALTGAYYDIQAWDYIKKHGVKI